jgi:predicted RNA-binding protein YlqC (UPF0109 family)
MREIIEKIIKHIVEQKDLASVEEIEGLNSNTLIARVAGEDYGRIVGVRGRTIQMFQEIVQDCGILNFNKQYRLILEEPVTKEWGKSTSFVAGQEWNKEDIITDVKEFLGLYAKLELNVVDVGNNVIFECKFIEQRFDMIREDVANNYKFIIKALCKGYGRNAILDIYRD